MPKLFCGVTIPTLLDLCVDVVEGRVGNHDKNELAVQILRYVQQQRATGESEDAIEDAVYELWHFDEPRLYSVQKVSHLETIKDAQGAERLVIVSVPLPEVKPKPSFAFDSDVQ